MRCSVLAILAPCALLLSACTTVTPAYKDIGVRHGPCVAGGPDEVAQNFYDYRLQHPTTGVNDLSALRPWLSDDLYQQLSAAKGTKLGSDPFSSASAGFEHVDVASASTIPNTDARNIPLRVTFTKGDRSWKDEVLMIREGQCWAVDDVRYLSPSNAPSGYLRQSLANF